MKKTILSALLASAFIPGVAMAQAPATTETPAAATGTTGTGAMDGSSMNDAAAPAASGSAMGTAGSMDTASTMPFAATDAASSWRFTELTGLDVYGSEGEEIGQINDLLIDPQGQVTGVLVGVGGFLGIGEKDVAVSMDALQFDMVDATTTAATGTAPTGATTGAMNSSTASSMVGTDLPERVTIDVTREQLEQAPAYEDVADASGAATGGAMGTAPATGTTTQ